MDLWLAAVALVLATIPAVIFARNLRRFAPPPPPDFRGSQRVSVLIPARNEERTIEDAVVSALMNEGPHIEVVVLDDHSTDDTALVVRQIASLDERVRLVSAPELPAGWCGKQHACHVLAQHARFERLCFMDADVRLGPDAVARLLTSLHQTGSDLVSGFPRETTVTFLERLLLPMIHFVLAGFLPIDRMRRTNSPAYAAGCGQLILTTRDAYRRSGGHAAIRSSLHDGIKLARAFRTAGLKTDIVDASSIAECRMYGSAAAVWRGLSKNAVEGMAAPARILPFTILLFGGHVLPLLLVVSGAAGLISAPACLVSLAALLLSYAPRFAAANRWGHSRDSVLLHPLGVLLLLVIQWYALGRHLLGLEFGWKGRTYAPAATD